MADNLESVKALAQSYRRWSAGNESDNPKLAERQLGHAVMLEAAALEMEDARRRLRPLPTTYGDLSDLPPEVLSELNLVKVDELEQQIRDIVAAADGAEVGLDPVIIELYRRHKVVHPRRFIMNKLYRMAQKGLLEAVEGRKGVYCIPRAASSDFGFSDDLDDDVPF
jgi:hypothetical protein